MRPSRCACDPPRDYAVSHSPSEITAVRDETGGPSPRSRGCERCAAKSLSKMHEPRYSMRGAPEESDKLTHDAIGALHRAWDERRIRFRSLARAGQPAKGAGASPARISSQRTEIGDQPGGRDSGFSRERRSVHPAARANSSKNAMS